MAGGHARAVLGVDVGGTKTAVAPVDRRGNMLAAALVSPSRSHNTIGFLSGLEDTIRQALEAFGDLAPQAVRGAGDECDPATEYLGGLGVGCGGAGREGHESGRHEGSS